ncbi:hypothetical protein [Afifella sp. IM 167]|uniref:hypothetical protein n=1 Tax=Afifella sp. IM 167 TaxID=2033586 RepID=UPI001CC9FCBB|nr:hypothetical protein [Afifella sp. IM 167]MBZ8132570.1 hypothetical protein [Afifella sp. IM 167]
MVTRQRLVLALGLSAASLLAAEAAHAGSDCTCRAKGGVTAREGDTICIATPNGQQMARCEKVLNNTSWKFLNTPCPSASNGSPATWPHPVQSARLNLDPR